MKVLVACEESQAVCIAFRKLGHEAYSCDTQECSGGHPEWHIKGDVLPLINGNKPFITMDGDLHAIVGTWDLLIAFPPCTYLTNAGSVRLRIKGEINKERMAKAVEAKAFFMKFLEADCQKICVENPTPGKIHQLPQYTQAIQPWWFGHPYTKRTCLWLKNLPPPLPLPILFGKELPRMLMEVVKTLMGITGDFRVGMSVTQKLAQKHFRVLHKQWPDSGEAI
ncbi:DNA cytosine methyltransferase [Flavonifractor plautii]|uniref:DNA cytosine methyltransferase n=1 Tax=Flavonifractor plautii TaxID=292800 RepID=UPI001D05E931|nr:DNA cytosine methyltransferase [Flavonifractor plautii]MCB7358094.1 DNA cytosine methyltransferase [Flavonifractor plautii]